MEGEGEFFKSEVEKMFEDQKSRIEHAEIKESDKEILGSSSRLNILYESGKELGKLDWGSVSQFSLSFCNRTKEHSFDLQLFAAEF